MSTSLRYDPTPPTLTSDELRNLQKPRGQCLVRNPCDAGGTKWVVFTGKTVAGMAGMAGMRYNAPKAKGCRRSGFPAGKAFFLDRSWHSVGQGNSSAHVA